MTNSRKYKSKNQVEYSRIFNKCSKVQPKISSLHEPLIKQKHFIIRSLPLNNNEWDIESRKKNPREIQKSVQRTTAHYYYYILCRRQVQLSAHTKLNKKHLLISGEIGQKVSHPFKNSIKENLTLPKTTKPVTSLMWTLLNKRKSLNQSIAFEEHPPLSKKTGGVDETKFLREQILNKEFRKEKKKKFPGLRVDDKMETGAISINRNAESFFPYRKSFLCYWLLPFVGFVSSATLSFNPQSTEEKSISFFNNTQGSNSYRNEKNKLNDSANFLESHMPLITKDKNSNVAVFYENGDISPGNKVSGRNRNKNLTDSFFCYQRKKNLTKSFNKSDLLKSNLLEPKETFLIPFVKKESTYSEKDESLLTSDYFVKMSLVPSSSLNAETDFHLKLNKQSISNSYKYCLYYLQCLEDTLPKPRQKDDSLFLRDFNAIKNQNLSSREDLQFSARQPYESLTKTKTGLASSNFPPKNSLFYKDVRTEQLKSNTGFYLTSFFNRVLLSKSFFSTNTWDGKFDNSLEDINTIEPLKINLNVPVSYLYDSNLEGVLPKPLALRTAIEFRKTTLSQIPYNKNSSSFWNDDSFSSKNCRLSNFKNPRIYSSLRNIISEQVFLPRLKSSQEEFKNFEESRFNSLNQRSLTYLNTYFNKKNPVTCFIRASTLLDKYMVYKTIFSQFKNEKHPPSSEKTGGVAETLFPQQVSNSHSNFSSHINSSLVNKLFSYYSNQLFGYKNLELAKASNLEKKKTINDSSGAFESAFGIPTQANSLDIILKKIAFAEENLNVRVFFENAEVSNKIEGFIRNDIFSQLSKEKLYKLILVDLANNLKNIAFPLDSEPRPTGLGSTGLGNNSKLTEGTYDETSSLIQFKHPLLMSNHIAYPAKIMPSNKKNTSRIKSSILCDTSTLSSKTRALFDSNELNTIEKYSYKKSSFAEKTATGLPENAFPGDHTLKNSLSFSDKDSNFNNIYLKKIIQSNIEQRPLIYQDQNNSYWTPNKNGFSNGAVFYENGEISPGNKVSGTNKNLQFPFFPKSTFPEKTDLVLEESGEARGKSVSPSASFFSKNASVIQKLFLPQMLFAEQIKNYLSQYTSYALKDFLILNRINTHLKPINTEPYTKNSLFQPPFSKKMGGLAKTNFPRQIKRDYLAENTENSSFSKKTTSFVPETKFPEQKKTPFFILNIPRIIDKNVKKTTQYLRVFEKNAEGSNKIKDFTMPSALGYEKNKSNPTFSKKTWGLAENPFPHQPTKKVFLTYELPFKFSKKYQSDKKAKLLRTYFSIKKTSNLKERLPSKSNSLEALNATNKKRMNSIFDSSSKLKQKITINLMSKSLLQKQNSEAVVQSLDGLRTNNFTTNLLIMEKTKREKIQNPQTKFSEQKILLKKFNLPIWEAREGFEQKKMKEVEARIASPRLLVNNRLFMNINVVKKRKDDLNSKNMNEPNGDILTKRKSTQKKRRITKLKKETRRRKKRMRFYPRPLWLRYRFYSQFLKYRHYSKSFFAFNNLSKHEGKKSLDPVFFENGGPPRNAVSATEQNLLNSRYLSMRNVFPYHAGNASLDISSSVMGELKTAFWKSYWLRSNLKPYLSRIKTSLRDMKESSRQLSQTSSFFEISNNQLGKSKLSPPTLFSKKKINSYYKTSHYLAEYNQISEQRIRQFVSQIRENLTLNGNAKVRPSRIIVQFTPYNRTSKMKGINLLKRPTLRYDALSRLRLYWALSKGNSNLVISGASGYPPSTNNLNSHFYNKRKQLWTTEKLRQQTKENKTKKLYNNLKTKIQSFLNDTPYFMLQDRGSLTDAMLLKSLRKIRIQNEKLYSLSFVHNKQNNFLNRGKAQQLVPNENDFCRSPNENYVRVFEENAEVSNKIKDFTSSSAVGYYSNQFKIRHNRLKNSSIGTSNAYPFISGKTSYWWLQFNPTTMNGLGSSISNSINNKKREQFLSRSSIQNLFGQNCSSSTSTKNTHKNLVSSNNNSYIYSSTINQQSNESLLQINTLLFHFCSLITLLSISQIRGLLKFSFIGLNKVFTLFERLTPSFLYKPFFTTDAYSNKSLNLNTKTPFVPETANLHRQFSSANFGSNLSFNKNKFVPQIFVSKTSDSPLKASSRNTKEPNFSQQNLVDSRINKQFLNILDPFFLADNYSPKKQTPFSLKTGRPKAADTKFPKENIGQKRSYMDRFLQDKVFDLNKRNDSFVYLFYAAPLEQNLLSSSSSLPQNGLLQSFLKTPLKQSFSEQSSKTIGEEPLTNVAVFGENGGVSPVNFVSGTKGSRQLISTFNLRFLLIEKPFGFPPTVSKGNGGSRENEVSISSRDALQNKSISKKIFDFLRYPRVFFENADMGFNMSSSIIGFYSLLNFSLKKPIVFVNKWLLRLTTKELRKKSLSITPKSTFNSVDENRETLTKMPLTEMNNNIRVFFGNAEISKKIEDFLRYDKLISLFNNKIVLYSLFGLKQILGCSVQVSQNFSTLLGQRAKLENGLRSIYMFFEKPGVLIVDWVAYLFLVEWASDITNTLPENLDTQIVGSPFNKLTRTIYSVSALLPGSQLIFESTVFRSLTNYSMNMKNGIWSSGFLSQITFLSLASTFLRRRMYHLYEILVFQFYQPDTDLLVRQRKGIVFWDIWGDFLTQTAEDSNINISELTSLKEEQMKLLENASLEIADPVSFENGKYSPKNKAYLFPGKGSPFSPKTAAGTLFSIEKKLTFQKNIMYSKKTSLSSIRRFKDQIYTQKMGGSDQKTVFNVSSFKPTASIKSLSSSFLGIPLQPRSQKQENRLHQWGSQQFLSYAIKSKDTELFIDLHPPRALSNLLKNKDSSQQLRSISPLGSLVCQIFTGILTK